MGQEEECAWEGKGAEWHRAPLCPVSLREEGAGCCRCLGVWRGAGWVLVLPEKPCSVQCVPG